MGTLGKILLFVNFAAFGGLMYFATNAWAARQAAAANALKCQLAIVGVPVESPTGATAGTGTEPVALGTVVSNYYPVEAAPAKVLEDLFAGTSGEEFAGGPFPRTQLAAVDAAKQKADALLSGLAPAEQIARLGGKYAQDATGRVTFAPGWLATMAETYAERVLVRNLADPTSWARQPDKKEANAKTLMAMFDRRFEAVKRVDASQADTEAAAVKAATDTVRAANDEARRKYAAYTALIADTNADPAAVSASARDAAAAFDKLNKTYDELQATIAGVGTTASRDEGDRRRRIAHVLMPLAEGEGWQKRVALTVGLRTYLAALSDQATRFKKMAGSAEAQIVLDQARFADEYDLLKNLAIGQSLLLKAEIAVRTDYQNQRAKDEESVTQRRLVLEDRRLSLAAVNERLAAKLAAQAEAEQRLFQTRAAVGEMLDRTFQLEADLKATEPKK
jgi:hypothetical protein